MQKTKKTILLFNDECGICRSIAHWVLMSEKKQPSATTITIQPIGDDPDALRLLNPDLDIWDAYETIHLLMPDGTMKVGGEAVAIVLQSLPNTKWFAWIFQITFFGVRPFQTIINLAYTMLSDIRPLFGCESCGEPIWARPFAPVMKWIRKILGKDSHPQSVPHFTSFASKAA